MSQEKTSAGLVQHLMLAADNYCVEHNLDIAVGVTACLSDGSEGVYVGSNLESADTFRLFKQTTEALTRGSKLANTWMGGSRSDAKH